MLPPKPPNAHNGLIKAALSPHHIGPTNTQNGCSRPTKALLSGFYERTIIT